MLKDSKIYVAGGTGLVGSAIINKLAGAGYNNIVSTYNGRKPLSSSSSIKWSKLDLTNQSAVGNFFTEEKPEYVFLTAAKVGGILANSTYMAEFIYDNLAIALNVIDSSYKTGVKKLLNLGSSCIYPKFAPQPMKEEYLLTGSLEPTNEPYSIAKIAAIKLCRYYNEQYGTNYISVMPTNLYGPNDNFNLETSHVLPALVRKFYLGRLLRDNDFGRIIKDIERYPLGNPLKPLNDEKDIEELLRTFGITKGHILMWGSGEVYREFMYVDDLADACVFLVDNFGYKDTGEFINIGTGEDIKLKDLAVLIKNITGYGGDIKYDTSKPDGTPKKLLDVSKIKALGWQTKINLEEGIRRTYKKYSSV
ncbi:MAG: GDP-L-fucose synthase family protein [Burkholderiales bacterium]